MIHKKAKKFGHNKLPSNKLQKEVSIPILLLKLIPDKQSSIDQNLSSQNIKKLIQSVLKNRNRFREIKLKTKK